MLFESHVTGAIEGLKIATDYINAWSLNNAPIPRGKQEHQTGDDHET